MLCNATNESASSLLVEAMGEAAAEATADDATVEVGVTLLASGWDAGDMLAEAIVAPVSTAAAVSAVEEARKEKVKLEEVEDATTLTESTDELDISVVEDVATALTGAAEETTAGVVVVVAAAVLVGAVADGMADVVAGTVDDVSITEEGIASEVDDGMIELAVLDIEGKRVVPNSRAWLVVLERASAVVVRLEPSQTTCCLALHLFTFRERSAESIGAA